METAAGRICWMDLAAADAPRAVEFYAGLFGWQEREHAVAGGRFMRLRLGDADVGSLYQLSRAHLQQGVPSHWTPYVRVDDLADSTRRVVALGGRVVVDRFVVPGLASIALITDPNDALLGLWQPEK